MFFLDTILPIFATTVLPVFLVAAAGFVLAWRLPLDSRTLGRILFYLATPTLVFRSLYQMQIDAGALRDLALISVTVTVTTALLGWLVYAVALALTGALSNEDMAIVWRALPLGALKKVLPAQG